MKKDILKIYTTPAVAVCEVAAEAGFGDSGQLPGFGSDDDELQGFFFI